MGCFGSKEQSSTPNQYKMPSASGDIKIHTVVSAELDPDHLKSQLIPLERSTDEQLLAEIARRQLDINTSVTMVRYYLLFCKSII